MVRVFTAGSAVAAVLCTVSAFARGNSGKTKLTYERTVAINSPTEWCMFLPPKPGQRVGPHEYDAVAFCTTPKPPRNAPGARTFPKGFITATHYQEFENYVQVTGRFNPDKYKMSRSDGGGQFDMKAPYGGLCAGYKRFVNLVEPNIGIYCIRCCKDNDKKLCNTYKSEYGCKRVINGNYGPQSNQKTVPMEQFMPSNFTAPATVILTHTVTAMMTPKETYNGCSEQRKCPGPTMKPAPAPPSPTDLPGMKYPNVESLTFRFETTRDPAPVVVSGDAGCLDLNPRGRLDWSVPNNTISYASAFIPGGISARLQFFVEEGCRGLAVYELEKDTITTNRPTAVDILPEFYGNFVGPQSALVGVTEP